MRLHGAILAGVTGLAVPASALSPDDQARGVAYGQAFQQVCVETRAEYRAVLAQVVARSGRPNLPVPEDSDPDAPLFTIFTISDPTGARFNVIVDRKVDAEEVGHSCALASNDIHPEAARAVMLATPGIGSPDLSVVNDGKRYTRWTPDGEGRDERLQVTMIDSSPVDGSNTRVTFTRKLNRR